MRGSGSRRGRGQLWRSGFILWQCITGSESVLNSQDVALRFVNHVGLVRVVVVVVRVAKAGAVPVKLLLKG